VRGVLQSYHEHGIPTPECLLIELNRPLLLHLRRRPARRQGRDAESN
jgi:hypothetical protein